MRRLPVLLLIPLLWCCADMDYDTSKGINSEITLFSDEVSAPIADIGPITPKTLMAGSGVDEMLKDYVKEDEEGYLVVDSEESFYNNMVVMISYFLPNPAAPDDVSIDNCSGNLGSTASILQGMGFGLYPQVFSLTASNPLTEDISVSGKLTIFSQADGETPAESLLSKEFSNVTIPAGSSGSEILSVENTGGKAFYGYQLENLFLHLPASILEKDPLGGFGGFSLGYHYKSFLSLANNLFEGLSVDINDLDLQLSQYRVKEARICTDVSNEIPITLEVNKVEVLVERTDDAGNPYPDVYEDVSVTPGLVIASGTSGHPVVSPLEIEIKAKEGTTIPDVSGLRLYLSVKAPVGLGDKRLGMNQKLYFNKLRATISGGITFQGL